MYVASDGIKTAVILRDESPRNPRDKQGNLEKMVCWHEKYDLGDAHGYADSREFAMDLARKYLSAEDVFEGIFWGKVDGYRTVPELDEVSTNPHGRSFHYVVERHDGLPGHEKWKGLGWEDTGWKTTKDVQVQRSSAGWEMMKDFQLIASGGQSLENLLASFSTKDLFRLLRGSDHVVILPVYVSEAFGPSVSTRSFVGKEQHVDWDSGRVGYIYLDKETAVRELCLSGEWKKPAKRFLEAVLAEYDNYLQGNVYGYECYKGTEKVDSCEGIYPGVREIQDVVKDELEGWFGNGVTFFSVPGDDFNIKEFFKEHDFPELRGQIRKKVETQLHHTAQRAERRNEAFPYAVSYEDICWNKDNVLCDVIEALYNEHRIPSEEKIHEVFQNIAGIFQEIAPKGIVQDILADAALRSRAAQGERGKDNEERDFELN